MTSVLPTQQHAIGDGNDSINNTQLTRGSHDDDGLEGVFERLEVGVTEQDTSPLEYLLHGIRLWRLEYAQLRIFIPPMAKANLQARDDALFPLIDKVQEFLVSEREVMLILGDSGAGKSTYNRHLEHKLWTEYYEGGPIPLYIHLSTIDNPAQDMIEKQLQILDIPDDHIQELKELRQFILICDGYDESQLTANLHKANCLNQLGEWRAKMIISCRSQFLDSDYLDRFVPETTNHHKAIRMDLFQEAVITPFSESQVKDYVEQYVPLEPRIWVTEDYMRMLTKIPNLMDLVRNPFLLTLALEVLPAITKQKEDFSTIRITRVHLYDIFVVHWLNVNKQRLESNTLSAEDRIVYDHLLDAGFIYMGIDYSTRLASAIFEKQDGNPLVQYIHVQDQNTWKAKFFGMDPEVRLLQESAPLTRSGNYFLFIHRSMQEYFFSRVIYSPVETDENEFDPQVETAAPASFLFDGSSPLFQRNLLKEHSIIQFLCDRVNLIPEFEKQLRAVIDQSKTDASVTIAATNAITILVKAGANFNGANLRNVKIPGADLSSGQFDSAQFQGADLTGVNLTQSWLRQANLSGALMEDQWTVVPTRPMENCWQWV
ncbi:WD repeat-containing protein 38 [Linnemannia gamsii]|uniref:WD repeat-containing protein 38 n=1 Tax=Linnemannia gamsii TaxID=64522 RepID=A0ABQ7JW31_9FUNG|nr:WD repeat-containing protein 38 [Linnemannia gamsii]